MTSKHRVLQAVLFLLGVDAAARGLLTIFASKWILEFSFPNIPSTEISRLLFLQTSESGALDIGISVMVFRSLLRPEPNVAIIDGLAVALAVAAPTSLVMTYSLGIEHWFPAGSLWGHSLLRFAVAALLIYLRIGPRQRPA